ncbi:T9SS type A sorting domain-containing protein [Taibaiella koreensis]|uniref:T9SS type A sorting domain-containing protein n=1 Tax=Taibaiella koreensis TaxID=1268548 RepID=UPI000E59B9BF|nr:T9SS type A sorting domain-containing protein [Taibaiella koreensis]
MKKILTLALLFSGCLTLQAQQGTLDATFNPGTALDFNGANSLALQPDGKILVGGGFSKHVARLNNDGTVDASFSLTGNGFNSYVPAMALQSDGKVVVGGGFTEFNNLPIPGRIARLNSDGSVDATFKTNLGTGITTDYSSVNAVALQSDDKILVGGEFDAFNGTANNNILRLNSDGTRDAAFNTGTGFNRAVACFAIQPDGKILVGGSFWTYKGLAVPPRLVRLNADGTLDATFGTTDGFDGTVNSIAIQPDGKMIIAGFFSNANGLSRAGITRLNSDGTTDATFNVGTALTGPQPFAHAVKLQSDGKVLLGGQFVTYNGTSINRIARLNADGSLDATFNVGSGCDQTVLVFAIQPNEKIIIAGELTTYNGTSRNFVARLTGPDNIKTGALTVGNFCQNPAVAVSFTVTGTINSGNVFTAQLSDASGSFSSPVAIGTLSGTASGTINAMLPSNTPSGTGYRIRVVSSSPALTGSDNGEDISITNVAPAVIQRTSNTLSTILPYATYQWIRNNASIPGATNSTYTVTANGSYQVAVTNTGGCKDTSDVFTVTNLSLDEREQLAQQVRLYPNPAKDMIHIQSPVKVNVAITGIEGKMIREESHVSMMMLNDLPAGIYLLRISDTKGMLIKTEKLIIAR